jgi:ribonuclease E
MANKMLIDATHPEETRVVVVRGNRVEEFDFESANRKQLRGNIYLAKVTRVEPSLQAAASSPSAKSIPTTIKSPSPIGRR